jgi:hypothetical protein
MDISITTGTARGTRASRVSEVDEDEARTAARRSGHSAHSNSIVLLLIDDNVVSGALRETLEVAGQVALGEGDGASRVNGEKLAPVKDLHTVVGSLTANDNVVLIATDLTPDRVGGVGGQTAKVDETASRGDLGERSAVGLGDDDELATSVADPAPRGRALTSAAAKVGMADKVVEVDLQHHGQLERTQSVREAEKHTLLQRKVSRPTMARPLVQGMKAKAGWLSYCDEFIAPLAISASQPALMTCQHRGTMPKRGYDGRREWKNIHA